MPIRLKVARTEKELDDVFRLRHQVYVEERGKFSRRCDAHRIVDRFDAMPSVANIVAYDGDQAVATMRINRDSAIGLPPEAYFDFSSIRTRLESEWCESTGQEPVLVSGGMLAVHAKWRNRRNVIFALFKTAAGVMHGWGATHVVGAISRETLSLYGRIGFEPIGEAVWVEEVNDELVPILAPFDKVFAWSYGSISDSISPFWLNNFCATFERLLLSPGDVLFRQGDAADCAYAIDEGWVMISRTDEEGNEMVLANLSRGALFGELAILDREPRSATATALTNVGLIVLERDALLELIREHPERLGEFLRHFAKRVRDLDDLAMIQAFAPGTRKVEFALQQLWRSATVDRKQPEVRVANVGVKQVAKLAQLSEEEAMQILEVKRADGVLDFGRKTIRFYRPPFPDSEPATHD